MASIAARPVKEPATQSNSIVLPVPSQDALQYLPSDGCGHVHGGFLHFFSSAMISSQAFYKNGSNNGDPKLNTKMGAWVQEARVSLSVKFGNRLVGPNRPRNCVRSQP